MKEAWVREVLDFWFGLQPEQWWEVDFELDAEIRDRFLALSQNMFRGHADSFATDHMALAIARSAVDSAFDEQLPPRERGVLYMPFQHSEELEDQRRSVALFSALGDDFQLGFARKHLEVIERFGRFPHRNAILGRSPRPDEVAAGDVFPW